MSVFQEHIVKEGFRLESGKEIESLKIVYSTFGELNEEKDNVVWVFHALTANSNVFGWWKGLFGQDCLFNAEDYFIVCANVIGSSYGSSHPEDLTFPQFTVRDVVKAHLVLAEQLEISKIHCAIGGSFGGNQALEFAYSFQGELEHLILIASCAKESAWGIAVHETQRLALKADPTFGKPNGGKEGLKAARGIGMLTYRTAEAFNETQTDLEEKTDGYRAASYIQYQGDKFTQRFDAVDYYYLTKCLDSHNIGRDRGRVEIALASLETKTLIIGISTDQLIPVDQQQFMAQHIKGAIYEEIHSDFGHDGFLIETQQLTTKIKTFIK